jgi:hypothetical protein
MQPLPLLAPPIVEHYHQDHQTSGRRALAWLEAPHIRLPLPKHLMDHQHPRADRDALGTLFLALAALDAQGSPRIVVAAARERGRARDLTATVAELLAELECGS